MPKLKETMVKLNVDLISARDAPVNQGVCSAEVTKVQSFQQIVENELKVSSSPITLISIGDRNKERSAAL